MRTHADSMAERREEHQRDDLALLRVEGDWDFRFEPNHPMLRRPRLTVSVPAGAPPVDIEARFTDAGWGVFFPTFMERCKR